MSAQTTQRVADVERALGQNLERTNWNMAGRGLQASSIKDQSKAEQAANAAGLKGGAISELTNYQNYARGQLANFETTVRPSIEAKYVSIGDQRRRAAEPPPGAEQPPAAPQLAQAPATPGVQTPGAPKQSAGYSIRSPAPAGVARSSRRRKARAPACATGSARTASATMSRAAARATGARVA